MLFESDAIVEYLDDKYSPIEEVTAFEQKALDRVWSGIEVSNRCYAKCGNNGEAKHKEIL
ncbi:hypothetical protein O9929_16820 [Vibrio lentus]|nr:hypothetical protein [Vibrio lentus]